MPAAQRAPFGAALAIAWAEPMVRRFTLFVLVAMLACGGQDLVLDPFAGRVLGLTPGETARLTGLQHAAAVIGMAATASVGGLLGRDRPGLLRLGALAGCALSAAALAALALAGALGSGAALRPLVAALGFGNGMFTVAAVGSMMALAGAAGPGRAGLRMGLWGAAQALAFALGAVLGPALVQAGLAVSGAPGPAYAAAFLAEAALFLAAAALLGPVAAARAEAPIPAGARP